MGLVTTSVAEQAATALRTAIVTGELEPGQRYTADYLAQRYGVSRTPVREALVRLNEAGFVLMEPKVGFRVIERNVRDVQDLFQMRLFLEIPAAYRAAHPRARIDIKKLRADLNAMDEIAQARAAEAAEATELDRRYVEVDTSFHERILRASGNQRLADVARDLRDNLTALGAWRFSQSRRNEDGRLEDGLLALQMEHKALLQAIEDREPGAAAQAMYTHLVTAGNLFMTKLEEDDDETFDRDWYAGVAVPTSDP
jgi:DNA-binding GntR family transcriptional regulator